MRNLNENIYVLLVQKKINNFSIGELKDAYMAEFKDYKTENEARSFIYRQVYKLVNTGYLIKNGKSFTKNIKYNQTELFKSEFYNHSFQVSEIDSKKTSLKLKLSNKLIKYNDLLDISTAEMEEYQRCANQYPHLRKLLNIKLDSARQKRSQFIGKVIAIKNILDEH